MAGITKTAVGVEVHPVCSCCLEPLAGCFRVNDVKTGFIP
jgi:hypothetical protein